jgi:hypothetical protein
MCQIASQHSHNSALFDTYAIILTITVTRPRFELLDQSHLISRSSLVYLFNAADNASVFKPTFHSDNLISYY